MLPFKNPHKKQAFSLIEMLLVLGVLSILLLAAFVLYPQLRDSSQANKEASNLASIKAVINNMYLTQGNYQGLMTGLANQARAFPASMNEGNYGNVTSSAIRTSWGGRVQVDNIDYEISLRGASSRVLAPNHSFVIRYFNVPVNICLKLIPSAAGNFDSILVGSGSNDTDVLNDNSLDMEALTTACKGDAIQIAFIST